MGWIFGLIALAALALVFWDGFIRGRRGAPLAWSVAAALVLAASGIAKGADARDPWPLVGLAVGLLLSVIAERSRRRAHSSAG